MSEIDKIFNNVNAVGLTTARYGVREPIAWPGPATTKLNQFNSMCYDIVTGFVRGTPDDIKYSSAGLKCQDGMLEQIKLSGKSPCANWLPPPIITPREQHFANAFRETKDISKSLEICLKNARTHQNRDHCYLDAEALRMTIGNQKQTVEPFVENLEEEVEVCLEPGSCNNGCDGNGYWFWIILGIFFFFLILLIIFVSVRGKNGKRSRRKK